MPSSHGSWLLMKCDRLHHDFASAVCQNMGAEVVKLGPSEEVRVDFIVTNTSELPISITGEFWFEF